MITVFNIMFAPKFGGIERVFCDYNTVLKQNGVRVINIVRRRAVSAQYITQCTVGEKSILHELSCRNMHDPICAFRLRKLIKKYKPRAMICHGNRAVCIAKMTFSEVPVIGVTHNYSLKRQLKADRLICLTPDLKRSVMKLGYNETAITLIPNFVEVNSYVERLYRKPVIIGAIGRFAPEKNFPLLIEAIYILKKNGIKCRAVLAGDGVQKEQLMAMRDKYELADILEMPGWIENVSDFYNSIDIFILSSSYESFGVVLLEAMSHSLPVITTNALGPAQIIEHQKDGVVIPVDDLNLLGKLQEEQTIKCVHNILLHKWERSY